MQLGDCVRVLGCGCEDAPHVLRHGIVTAVDHQALALEVLLNEPHPFYDPPRNEVCGAPIVLEVAA